MGSKRVDLLVLGASFAGIEVLYQLWRRYDGKFTTVVVDRQRGHGYLPLVQERLCGRLPPDASTLDTAAYIESLPRTTFIQDDITSFSPDDKMVTLASGETIRARMVVVALGSVLEPPSAIVGGERLVVHKLAAQFDDARSRLGKALAEDAPSVVVAGGGITGVELAGELADLKRTRPDGWNPPKVTLVTASDRLVENLPASVARRADRALGGHGVEVKYGMRLVEVGEDAVTVEHRGKSETLDCSLAFWAGGVAPGAILAELGLPRTDDGWLAVGPTLQCFPSADAKRYDIFACGDAVRIEGGEGRWPTMQRAIECLWQAKVVAKNLVKLLKEKKGYPEGLPPLVPHTLRESFPYGVSIGGKSLLVLGGVATHIPGVTHSFRRFLMRQYFARYTPLSAADR